MNTGSDVSGMLASEQSGVRCVPGLFGGQVPDSQEDSSASQTDPGVQGDVQGQLTLELDTGVQGGEAN